MGLVKNQWIEEEERGWHFIADKAVYRDCIADYALQAMIDEPVEFNECDYGKTSSEAIDARSTRPSRLSTRGFRVCHS